MKAPSCIATSATCRRAQPTLRHMCGTWWRVTEAILSTPCECHSVTSAPCELGAWLFHDLCAEVIGRCKDTEPFVREHDIPSLWLHCFVVRHAEVLGILNENSYHWQGIRFLTEPAGTVTLRWLVCALSVLPTHPAVCMPATLSCVYCFCWPAILVSSPAACSSSLSVAQCAALARQRIGPGSSSCLRPVGMRP